MMIHGYVIRTNCLEGREGHFRLSLITGDPIVFWNVLYVLVGQYVSERSAASIFSVELQSVTSNKIIVCIATDVRKQ